MVPGLKDLEDVSTAVFGFEAVTMVTVTDALGHTIYEEVKCMKQLPP